jgi:hypothetical protein
MDLGVVTIAAAVVGAIATVAVAWIAARTRMSDAQEPAIAGPTASMNGGGTASSAALAAWFGTSTFVSTCRALVWVLLGLSYFLGFSGLTGASFSIGIVAVRAFADHAVSIPDSFVLQFAVLSAFGFFCASVWRTVLGLLPQTN